VIEVRKKITSDPSLKFWAVKAPVAVKFTDLLTGTPVEDQIEAGDWLLINPDGLIGGCPSSYFWKLFEVVN